MATRVEIISGQLAGSVIENAASESTLRELVNAVNKLSRSSGGGTSVPAGGGGGSSAAAAASTAAANATNTMGDAAGNTAKSFNILGSSLHAVGKTLGVLTSAVGTSTQLLKSNNTSLGDWTKELSGVASRLPIVGGAIGMLGSALGSGIKVLEEWNGGLRRLSDTGAAFNNSLLEFRKYAAMTNMDIAAFGAVVQKNADGLAALGGSVTEGVRSFAKVSKGLMASDGLGPNLINMGMSIQDVNQGLGSFLSSTLRGTRVTDQNAKEIGSMYADYATHLDKISKLTGESRKDLEKKAKADAEDAAWQMYLAGKDDESRAKLQMHLDTMRAQFGESGARYVKQMATLGTVTDKETRFMHSSIHGLGDNTRQMIANANNENIKRDQYTKQLDTFNAKTKVATDEMIARNKQVIYAGAAKIGSIGQVALEVVKQHMKTRNSNAELGKMTEQEIKQKYDQIKKEQASREALTSTLNTFSTGVTKIYNRIVEGITTSLGKLVERLGFNSKGMSGVFDKIMSSIDSAFTVFDSIITGTTDTFKNLLGPTSKTLHKMFDDIVVVGKELYSAFTTKSVPAIREFSEILISNIKTYVLPALEKIGTIITSIVLPAYTSFAGYIIDKVVPIFREMAYWMQDNVLPVLARLGNFIGDKIVPGLIEFGASLKPLTDFIFDKVIPALGSVVSWIGEKILGAFSSVLDVLENFSTHLEIGKLRIQEFGDLMLYAVYKILDKVTVGDKYKDLAAQQEKLLLDSEKKRQQLDEDMASKKKAREEKEAADQRARDIERHERQLAATKREEDARTEAAKKSEAVPATPATPSGEGLGGLSAKFESGARGSAAVGWDSTGGTSYGKYQIAAKTGTMDKFMQYLKTANPEAYERLSKAGPADAGKDGKFAQEWKALASSGKLGTSEHDFIKKTHYDVGMAGIKSDSLKGMIEKSKALQEVMWSTSVQHGGGSASKIFGKSFKEGMSEQDLIKAIYAERSTKFGSSTAKVQESVANRFAEESKNALAMVGTPGEASSTTVAAAPATPKEQGTVKPQLASFENLPDNIKAKYGFPTSKTSSKPDAAMLAKQVNEQREAERKRIAEEQTKLAAAEVGTPEKQASLKDVVDSIQTLNTQMTRLISVNEDLGSKQLKATGKMSGNLFGTA